MVRRRRVSGRKKIPNTVLFVVEKETGFAYTFVIRDEDDALMIRQKFAEDNVSILEEQGSFQLAVDSDPHRRVNKIFFMRLMADNQRDTFKRDDFGPGDYLDGAGGTLRALLEKAFLAGMKFGQENPHAAYDDEALVEEE